MASERHPNRQCPGSSGERERIRAPRDSRQKGSGRGDNQDKDKRWSKALRAARNILLVLAGLVWWDTCHNDRALLHQILGGLV